MSLEVVWNGAHLGMDADLLCTSRVVVKRRDVTPSPDLRLEAIPRAPTRARVEAVLKCGPATKRQLMVETGESCEAIRGVMSRLQRMGAIRVVGLRAVSKYRAQNVYGLV